MPNSKTLKHRGPKLDLNSTSEINSDLHFSMGLVCHGERGASAAHGAPLPLWRRHPALPLHATALLPCNSAATAAGCRSPRARRRLPSFPAVSPTFISSPRARPTAREDDGVGATDNLPLRARSPLSPRRRGGSRMDNDKARPRCSIRCSAQI
jgi:hypothetical protein